MWSIMLQRGFYCLIQPILSWHVNTEDHTWTIYIDWWYGFTSLLKSSSCTFIQIFLILCTKQCFNTTIIIFDRWEKVLHEQINVTLRDHNINTLSHPSNLNTTGLFFQLSIAVVPNLNQTHLIQMGVSDKGDIKLCSIGVGLLQGQGWEPLVYREVFTNPVPGACSIKCQRTLGIPVQNLTSVTLTNQSGLKWFHKGLFKFRQSHYFDTGLMS